MYNIFLVFKNTTGASWRVSENLCTFWSTTSTVYGPLLFRVYINDLPKVVSTSTLRLFAYDSLLYRQVRNQTTFRRPISTRKKWENKWQMSFHPAKCTVVRISTNKHNFLDTHYFLHEPKLEVVDNNKYLGATLSEDLSWRKHHLKPPGH